jgi:two-component system sensor histidine kinase RstB
MTWLFLRFYLCVLIVLFAAWYIYGAVWKWRAEQEMARVTVATHRGGARLVASALDAAPPQARRQVVAGLRKQFAYPLEVIAVADLPPAVQGSLRNGEDVAYLLLRKQPCVVAALADRGEAVRLGPFPNYVSRAFREAIGGWMRLAAKKLDAAPADRRGAALDDLQRRFDVPVEIVGYEDLPSWPKAQIRGADHIVFYSQGSWLAAMPLADGTKVVRFGPFPKFEKTEEQVAGTTLALVLVPAALAIALLLRPVAWQLHLVERAARAIASGDLTARVEERKVRSAKALAQAFNDMAAHTETMLRTQRDLLQAVSHELRTPLSRLRFAIDLVATAKDDAQRKRWLESLDATIEELDELVGELLAYVRMEATRSEIEPEPVGLRDVVEGLIPKYAALYPGVQFEVDQSIEAGRTIIADRAALQRALGNLLSNAGRFAKSRVVVGAQATQEATLIDVNDDGEGIPESERQRVFQPFVRLDNNPSDSGVGLGLALVKRIVERHGGTVEALAGPLGGCRIRITWPSQA